MVKRMEKNSTVRFKPVSLPDYHVEKEGASIDCTILIKPFDGKSLCPNVKDIRYTLQGISGLEACKWISYLSNSFGSVTILVNAIPRSDDTPRTLLSMGRGPKWQTAMPYCRPIHACINLPGNIDLWKVGQLWRVSWSKGKYQVYWFRNGEKPVRIIARKGMVLASGSFDRSDEVKKLGVFNHQKI